MDSIKFSIDNLSLSDVIGIEDYLSLFESKEETTDYQKLLKLTLLIGMKSVIEAYGTSEKKYTLSMLKQLADTSINTSSASVRLFGIKWEGSFIE
jgi:hypothetical protein